MKHKKLPKTQELIAKGVECKNWLHSIVVESPFFKVCKPDWIWHWENSSSWNCCVQGAWTRQFPEVPSSLNGPKILFHKPLLPSCTAQLFWVDFESYVFICPFCTVVKIDHFAMTEGVCETCVIKAGGRNTQTALRLGKQGTPLNTALSVKRESLGKKTLSAVIVPLQCQKYTQRLDIPLLLDFSMGTIASWSLPFRGPFWDSH